MLVQAPYEFNALDPQTKVLSARGLSRLLSSLLGDSVLTDTQTKTVYLVYRTVLSS
jgi:hypothetical protein